MIRKMILAVTLILAIALSGLMISPASAHTGYVSAVQLSSVTPAVFPNYTVNPGVVHYVQQSSPALNCRHSFYRVNSDGSYTYLFSITLGPTQNTGGYANGTSSPIKIHHTVNCPRYSGIVRVYFFHGSLG